MDDLQPSSSRTTTTRLAWVWDLLLLVVLIVGTYFRFTGVNWDSHTHLHPDERFLTMVSSALQPVDSLKDYFNTAQSTLNPHNRGYTFYVYGTLPIFIVRYAAEWLNEAGYDQIHLVGRQISAMADLLTVLLVYLIANRLYRKPPLSVLAASFAALQVLPIQQSHYFTVDTFANFFGFLAFYFAARLLPTVPLESETQVALAALQERRRLEESAGLHQEGVDSVLLPEEEPVDRYTSGWYKHWKTAFPYALFGMALGMAVASKINAAPLAILLPGAVLIRWLSLGKEDRERWALVYVRNLVIAALVSLVVFRICQPYAFEGPGFADFGLNQKWVQNIRDQRAQAAGDVDFPPALQWARRPLVWFPFQNMVIWGLGLPLGVLSWAGFAWMAWRIARGQWKYHILVWGWTAFYFAWQASAWNPTMRYLLLIYPSMAIIAAWTVFEIGKKASARTGRWQLWQTTAWGVGGIVLVLTLAWAYAFLQIYTRPLTRVAASRWIYQNMPGPINLKIEGSQSTVNHPLAFRSGYSLYAEQPWVLAFQPQVDGQLLNIQFSYINSASTALKTLTVAASTTPSYQGILATGVLSEAFRPDAGGDARGKRYQLNFGPPLSVKKGQTIYLVLTVTGMDRLDFSGAISLGLSPTAGGLTIQVLPEPVNALQAGARFETTFKPIQAGIVRQVELEHVVDWEWNNAYKTLRLTLADAQQPNQVLGSAQLTDVFGVSKDIRGEKHVFELDTPVEMVNDRAYILRLEFVEGPGQLAIYGSKQVNESSWDDALPWPLDGFNPYDYSAGVFRSDLNFEMYWDDNEDKRSRFYTNLDQADYIFISSNRQWGTTTRVPERYPLTSEYYRQLIGCPPEREITWCYSVAMPGTFEGNLGFELIEVFSSEPNLGDLVFNSQFAEEAFSVYDHPKVFIFRKTEKYDPNHVRALLGAVDLTQVIHLTPRKAGAFPGTLLLPADRLIVQQAGGTWSKLFNQELLYNRYPGLAVVVWYLVVSVLGWVMLPFTRLALGGLPDKGYPLLRVIGMLCLAYPVWLLGSYQVPFSVMTITLVFVGLVIVNGLLAWPDRQVILLEIRQRWKLYLLVEGLMLAFFVLFLLVRVANPDLWHPYKGGEKPMDFSYFNAVLKSTTFPPYDPWFAGGYINYYYFGFVLVGVPVKWLGITPAVAYNLILPSLFSMLAMGAFSFGWNMLESSRRRQPDGQAENHRGLPGWPLLAGLASALALVLLGNLGTVRMIWHGIQRLAPMNVPFDEASLPTHLIWTVQGLGKVLTGARLPYSPGDWYWIPSRAIPGEPITEFPAFTFLYADLHAHMIALPLTVLALAWALSVLLGRWDWKGRGQAAASFILGGLVIGVLKPTNTWDWPTYLALGCAAVIYTVMRYGGDCFPWLPFSPWVRRLGLAVVIAAALAAFSTLLFTPYNQWYGQGYNAVERWNEGRTPFWSYMTHWGLFLFVIVSWLLVETVDWMASTPLSALRKIMPYRGVILAGAVGAVGLALFWLIDGVQIAWLVIGLGLWAAVLLLRPGLQDARRAVLFMFGTALVLTLFVELFRLQGDIGRMNTVFKFYLQAWTLLALGAGTALFWVLPQIKWASNEEVSKTAPVRHFLGGNFAWQIALLLLVSGAALFPLMAGTDKMTDRMVRQAPHTLDGMAYMSYARYNQEEKDMDLSQDARAIRWMQQNIQGSPVIVEANTPEYRWGSRYTIYTGLPGVVGWNWHQRQQRAVTPDSWVFDRVREVGDFYNSTQAQAALDFLIKYNVKYIVVGQLERAVYSRAGLQKFEEYNGELWQEVYRDGETVIFRVDLQRN